MTEPKARWGDRAARERDIRRSALAALARDGYAGLSMRAVAVGAGVSQGTVYTYFSSKEDLYATLYAERLERLAGELAAACAAAGSLREAVAAAVPLYLDVHRTFGRELNVAAVMAGNTGLSRESAARLITAAMSTLGTINAQLARFEPDVYARLGDRLHLVAQLVWATANGLAEHFSGVRQQVFGTDESELVGFVSDVIVAGLRSIANDVTDAAP